MEHAASLKAGTAGLLVAALLAFGGPAHAQETGDRFRTLADLPFKNDYPTASTLRTLEDELYFQRAVQVYLWALPAMNMFAMKEGAAANYGQGYNVLSIWKERLGAKTLITTPNSDVIYGIGFLDLAKDGPMVLEVPSNLQALIDDFWHRPIKGPTIDGHTYYADIGLPGPDRGKGGKYLIVPPNFKGTVRGNGYFLYHSRTNGVFVFLRGFFNNPDNLAPAVENMERIRIYPLGSEQTAKPMQFPDASGKPANLLAPADGSYYAMFDRFVQSEVADYPDTAYMRGMAASIGIAKGQAFAPNDRQKNVLDAAAKTAWKMSKVVAFDGFERLPKALWYPDRHWLAHVRNGGDDFAASVDNFDYEVNGTERIDIDVSGAATAGLTG